MAGITTRLLDGARTLEPVTNLVFTLSVATLCNIVNNVPAVDAAEDARRLELPPDPHKAWLGAGDGLTLAWKPHDHRQRK